MALGHETCLKVFNRIEIILNVFCDDIRIKLEITNKKYIGRASKYLEIKQCTSNYPMGQRGNITNILYTEN